jgi:peroxiredoxin
MHEQAQLRLHKGEILELGAAVYVIQAENTFRTNVFKTENRLLSKSKTSPFSKEVDLVFSTALADPAGRASAIYGVSRKGIRWNDWIENHPCWFVINRKGKITYTAQPTFGSPTSYIDEVNDLMAALRQAAK